MLFKYQDVLISGIVETQKSARHGPETGAKSRLKEVLMVACREPSINKYTSGTSLYEYNSLKRSEKMLMGMQNKAVSMHVAITSAYFVLIRLTANYDLWKNSDFDSQYYEWISVQYMDSLQYDRRFTIELKEMNEFGLYF